MNPVSAAVAGAASTGLGWVGVEQVNNTGPDLAGIALLITAISGLIATVGALVIGLRRKPSDPALEIALRLLEREAHHEDEP